MAKQDRIDLIKEFTKIQKDNDYIILTTYCFDPFFFDVYLLNKIQNNNPTAEIILLVDAEQYEKSYNRFTKNTGRTYHLVPVYMNNGVFHPKFFLFLSESKKKLTLYIGSGNITLQGFTRNVELISKIEYTLTEMHPDINKILEILNGLLTKNLVSETKVVKIIQEIVSVLPSGKSDTKENPNYVILHNLEKPILSQLLNEIKDKKFKELLILAPFYSQTPNVLKELVNNINVERVILALQKNNHNLKNISHYSELLSKRGIFFEVKEACFEEPKRTFHSKILYLNGKEQYLLVGSPNFTELAMLRTAQNGNFECAILYKDVNAKRIIDSIHLNEIENLNDLLKTAESKQEISKNSHLLKIYSVDFDEINRTLKVKTEKINEKAFVSVLLENSGKPIHYEKQLDRGEIHILIPEGIPKEITIICGTKRAHRRIFYDKKYFFKRIVRSPLSFKEISDRLYNDFSIDISELLTLINGLSKRLEIQEKAIKEEKPSKEPKLKFYLPSKTRKISEISSLLRTLQEFYDWIEYRKHKTRELEESYSDEDLEEEPKPQYLRSFDKEEKIKRLINRIINKLNQVLLMSVLNSTDKSKEDALANAQTIFIYCFLRMFQNFINEEIFNIFVNTLEQNLKKIKREKCSQDSRIKLFSHILALNYCHDPTTMVPREKYIMRDLLFYFDLINRDNYYRVKQFVKEFIRQYYVKIEFNNDKFIEYYSDMMKFVFSPNDINKGIIDITNRILEEKDKEIIKMLGRTLYNLKSIWSITGSTLDKIRKIKENIEGDSEKIAYLNIFLND